MSEAICEQTKAEPSQKYEHLVQGFSLETEPDMAMALHEVIARLQPRGWEYVGGFGVGTQAVVVFKRPLMQENNNK